jgi:hypothetical protein
MTQKAYTVYTVYSNYSLHDEEEGRRKEGEMSE